MDERIVWIDRFNPTRPRMQPVRIWPYLRREGFGVFSLVVMAIGSVWLALDPALVREVYPEIENPRQIFIPMALVTVPLAIFTVAGDWNQLRHGVEVEVDFLLTPRRLLAKTPQSDEVEAVELAEVVSCHLDGATLVLVVTGPDKKIELFNLAEPESALQVFARTLLEIPAGPA